MILESLYEQGVKQGRQLDLSFDGHDLHNLEVYSNDAARLFVLWNTLPRLQWLTTEYYAQESSTLIRIRIPTDAPQPMGHVRADVCPVGMVERLPSQDDATDRTRHARRRRAGRGYQ